jgi:hypothetical protein
VIRPFALAATLLVWLPLARALADAPTVLVHVGSHPGYGRIVLDLPPHGDYHVDQDGQHLSVHVTGEPALKPGLAMPHNVLSLARGSGQIDLTVAEGTLVSNWRTGDHLVIDVFDKDAPQAANVANAHATERSKSEPQAQAQQADHPESRYERPGAPAPAPVPAPSPAQAAAPAPEPASPPVASAASAAEPQDETPAPVATPIPVKTIKTERPAAVAAFRRGNLGLVVIDQPLPLEPAASDAPPFDHATIVTLPTATVMQVPLEPTQVLSLAQSDNEWRITAADAEPGLQPIRPTSDGGRLNLPAGAPGGIVSVADPLTGSTLLVGTQQRTGQGVAVRHRAVGFILLPTWQGVAVEAVGDELNLRPGLDGFMLTAGAVTLALTPTTELTDMLTHAAGMTRRFDFSDAPPPLLMQRLQRQMAEEAATPLLSRAPRRLATAQTMIALGLGVEAAALLRLSAADDTRGADRDATAELGSIAALLGLRPDAAEGIAARPQEPTDDIAFWRAIREAELQPGSPRAAAELAATVPLVFSYPEALRARLLPLVAETLVAGGENGAAAALLARRPDDSSLDVARGMLKQAQGDADAALALYEKAAQSGDRRLHARGAVHAVEMRLASGKLDAHGAADALDLLLYAWRGDHWERALRERVAALRAQTGAWRTALTVLREGEESLPEDKAELHDELADMFATMLRENAIRTMSPLELVSLVDENTDVLPASPDGEALEARLADQLLELDLPARAGPLLDKLAKAAPTPPGRASFGLRLATLRLREGDADGALAALKDSEAEGLPAALVERRALTLAAAIARRGDTTQALGALSGLDTPAADEARATIYESANNWPSAEKALAAYAARTVPAEGRLDDAQRRTLLRLATAAARAGDEAALTDLGRREAERMQSGPLADVFRLLASQQVQGVADLRRSAREAALARELPKELKQLPPPTGTP